MLYNKEKIGVTEVTPIVIPEKIKKQMKKIGKNKKKKQKKMMLATLYDMMNIIIEQQIKIIKMIEELKSTNIKATNEKKLSNKDDIKEIISMKEDKGIPVKEIAERYSLSPKTIYRRISEYKKPVKCKVIFSADGECAQLAIDRMRDCYPEFNIIDTNVYDDMDCDVYVKFSGFIPSGLSDEFIRLIHHAEVLCVNTGFVNVHIQVMIDDRWYE